MLQQITVFLENKPGRLEQVTACLAVENINLHALSIADTTDFGILRLIVSDPVKAAAVLKDNGFMVKTAPVVPVAMGHSPGSLHKILRELKELDVSIEYMYAFTSRHRDHDAIVILSLADQAAALDKLSGSAIPVLGEGLLERLNEG